MHGEYIHLRSYKHSIHSNFVYKQSFSCNFPSSSVMLSNTLNSLSPSKQPQVIAHTIMPTQNFLSVKYFSSKNVQSQDVEKLFEKIEQIESMEFRASALLLLE